jgi:putative aminopeptidase FrvX
VHLIRKLIDIHSPSGEEFRMRDFLLDYVNENQHNWAAQPKLFYGEGFQDNLILVFGSPKTAVFAHMDTIGFTTRYEDQLVPIGGPDAQSDYMLSGKDSMGPIQCKLRVNDGRLSHDFARAVQRGTSLVFAPFLSFDGDFITGTHLDNRLGIYNALKQAETMENGAIVFSSYEEHGGGSVPYLTRFLYENYSIRNALISDITWVTDGVTHGDGVVISLRDQNIPRRKFIDKVISLAEESGVKYQLEVEGSGSSDGREVHHSPYPVDWVFIGAPEDNVHSPTETVHQADLQAMIDLYTYLLKNL